MRGSTQQSNPIEKVVQQTFKYYWRFLFSQTSLVNKISSETQYRGLFWSSVLGQTEIITQKFVRAYSATNGNLWQTTLLEIVMDFISLHNKVCTQIFMFPCHTCSQHCIVMSSTICSSKWGCSAQNSYDAKP